MRTFSSILLAAACGLAFAQAPVYRSTMPDGKKVISDRPMPGALKVEEIKVREGNSAPGSPVPREAEAKHDPNEERRLKARQNVEDAQRAYDEALAKQAKGKDEGPGDRIGTAKGGARISDDYYKRQEALAAEVEAARKRLEAAQQASRQLR